MGECADSLSIALQAAFSFLASAQSSAALHALPFAQTMLGVTLQELAFRDTHLDVAVTVTSENLMTGVYYILACQVASGITYSTRVAYSNSMSMLCIRFYTHSMDSKY